MEDRHREGLLPWMQGSHLSSKHHFHSPPPPPPPRIVILLRTQRTSSVAPWSLSGHDQQCRWCKVMDLISNFPFQHIGHRSPRGKGYLSMWGLLHFHQPLAQQPTFRERENELHSKDNLHLVMFPRLRRKRWCFPPNLAKYFPSFPSLRGWKSKLPLRSVCKIEPVFSQSHALVFGCTSFTLDVKNRTAIKEGRMGEMNEEEKSAAKSAQARGGDAPSWHAIANAATFLRNCLLLTGWQQSNSDSSDGLHVV